MNNLTYVRNILEKGSATCAFYDGDTLITRADGGILPLVNLIDEGIDLSKFSGADKIVGKAAAFAYVKLNIKELFCEVVSEGGLKVLNDSNISVQFRTKTPDIINRNKDGRCPMEIAVSDCTTCDEAVEAIKNKLKAMSQAS